MYCKKLVVLVMLISLIPIVYSVGDFQCSDETLLGGCNDNGELCIPSENLLDNDVIGLSSEEKYLYFGDGNCENSLTIGDRNFELVDTGERFTMEFNGFDFNGEINLPCDRNYLGKVSDTYSLYEDCNYCGECEEEVVEEEVIEEEICADFNDDGEINLEDYFMLNDSFGLNKSDEFFNENIDLDKNGKIELTDFFMFSERFGGKCDMGEIKREEYYVVLAQRDDSFYELGQYFADGKKASLLSYENNLEEVLPQLQKIQPMYLVLVLSPQKLTPDFMSYADRFLREIDEDIFLDVAYGYITSFDLEEGYKYVDKLLNYEIPDEASLYGINAEHGFHSLEDYDIETKLTCDKSLLEGKTQAFQICPDEDALDVNEMIDEIKNFDVVSIGLHGLPDRMQMLNNRWIEGDREGIKLSSPYGRVKLRIDGKDYDFKVDEKQVIEGKSIIIWSIGEDGDVILIVEEGFYRIKTGEEKDLHELDIYNYGGIARKFDSLDFNANLLTGLSCTTGRVFGSPSVLKASDMDVSGKIDNSIALSFLKSGVLNYISPFSIAYLDIGDDLSALITFESISKNEPIGNSLKHFKNKFIFNKYYLSTNLENKIKHKITSMTKPEFSGGVYSIEDSNEYLDYNTEMWILFGDPSIRLSNNFIEQEDCVKEFKETLKNEGEVITKTVDLGIFFIENEKYLSNSRINAVSRFIDDIPTRTPITDTLQACSVNIPLEGELIDLEINSIEGVDNSYIDYFSQDGIIKDLGDELLMVIPESVLPEYFVSMERIDLLINSVRYDDVKQGDKFLVEDKEVEIFRITDKGYVMIGVNGELKNVGPEISKSINGVEIQNLVEIESPYNNKKIDLSMTITMRK